MNPKVALLVFLAVVAVIAFGCWLVTLRAASGGARRRELNRALDAIDQIEAEADKYDEIDSVLAAQVKDIVRNYRKEQRSLR